MSKVEEREAAPHYIWTKLEFDAIGIPSGDVDKKDKEDDQRRCTIILTSRSRDL